MELEYWLKTRAFSFLCMQLDFEIHNVFCCVCLFVFFPFFSPFSSGVHLGIVVYTCIL